MQAVAGLPLDFPGRRVRVLMLARPGSGMWDTVAAELDKTPVDLADPLVLGAFTTDRAAAFREAASAFGSGIAPGCPVPPAPKDLTDPAYGSVLVLHMAALAAVWADSAGEQAPTDRQDLSQYLLRHERRGWSALAHDDPGTVASIETTAWLATLFGPVDGADAARALLQAAQVADGQADAGRVLARHEQLYPPVRSTLTGAAGPAMEVATLQPLRPDRFGEDFVGVHVRDRPHAAGLLIGMLTTDGRSGQADTVGEAGVRRCLTVVAAAAARHEAAQEVLWAVLRAEPRLGASGSALVLRMVVDTAPDDIAEALDRALPVRCGTELLVVAADLAGRTYAALPADVAPKVRADRLNDLGFRLSNGGRREEALTATGDAVEIYRRLAAVNPAALDPDLALSLNNLGMVLSELGRREEALAATADAVEIRRRLAAVNPAAFDPALAMSLNNLGAVLSELGRREEALAATADAVEIYRRLAAVNPAAFDPDLALSLNNLGMVLSELGRREEALAATADAVEIRRRLAAVNPAAFDPGLAAALNNLGIRLSELGRREEALAATADAVEIRRRLAAVNPAAFDPDLAMSLSNLGMVLSRLGRREEALAATADAVEIYRRLTAVNPAAFDPDLATSLSNLGAMLSRLGRREEALAATADAVEIRRRLAAVNPAAFDPGRAAALNNLGAMLSRLGRREEALAATADAVEIRRRLAAVNPAAFDPDLATSLSNLGIRLSELGRREEALAATADAVEIRRRLAAVNPAAFDPALARGLWTFGWVRFASQIDCDDGLRATEEAARLYERLYRERPEAFVGDLRGALTTRADLLDEVGRAAEAGEVRNRIARLSDSR